MALVSFVGSLGGENNAAAHVLASAVPQGNCVAVWAIYAAAVSPLGASDSRGNSYVLLKTGFSLTPDTFWHVAIYLARIDTALQVGDTITATGAKAMVAGEFSGRLDPYASTPEQSPANGEGQDGFACELAPFNLPRVLLAALGAWDQATPQEASSITAITASGDFTVAGTAHFEKSPEPAEDWSVLGAYRIEVDDVGPWAIDGTVTGADITTACIVGVPVEEYGCVRQVYTPAHRLITAEYHGEAGTLTVRRWADTLPLTTPAGDVVVGSGVTGCSLSCRGDGTLDLLYTAAGALLHRTSTDGGATWGGAATVLAAGDYEYASHGYDAARGMFLAAAWKRSDRCWYLSTGVSDGAGGITWAGAVKLSLGAIYATQTYRGCSATVEVLPNGEWRLAVLSDTLSGSLSRSHWYLFHPALPVDLTGLEWDGNSAGSSNQALTATTHDAKRGLLLAISMEEFSGEWHAMPGFVWPFAPFDWQWETFLGTWPSPLVGGAELDGVPITRWATPSLLCLSDGTFQLAYLDSAGAPAIARCSSLRAHDASGTWA